MSELDAADDLPHRAGSDAAWEESWWFDFSTGDAALGGFLALTVRPRAGSARFRAALVGDGRRYLLVRDDDVRAPSGATPEVRAEGLWSALECETPGLHWTVGLEAFAVALDDPLDAWGAERGDRVGLGFDLEWETAGDALPIGAGDQSGGERWFPCVVSGEVLVGAGERITVDAAGWRSRRWGLRRPLTPWIAGRFDDGRWLAPRADDLAATVRHAAPLLEDGARARYDLCEVRGPGGQGRAWRLTIP